MPANSTASHIAARPTVPPEARHQQPGRDTLPGGLVREGSCVMTVTASLPDALVTFGLPRTDVGPDPAGLAVPDHGWQPGE